MCSVRSLPNADHHSPVYHSFTHSVNKWPGAPQRVRQGTRTRGPCPHDMCILITLTSQRKQPSGTCLGLGRHRPGSAFQPWAARVRAGLYALSWAGCALQFTAGLASPNCLARLASYLAPKRVRLHALGKIAQQANGPLFNLLPEASQPHRPQTYTFPTAFSKAPLSSLRGISHSDLYSCPPTNCSFPRPSPAVSEKSVLAVTQAEHLGTFLDSSSPFLHPHPVLPAAPWKHCTEAPTSSHSHLPPG